jgi:hypothetical protein
VKSDDEAAEGEQLLDVGAGLGGDRAVGGSEHDEIAGLELGVEGVSLVHGQATVPDSRSAA